MLLSDLFDQLTYGELSSINYGGVDNEGIVAADFKRVIPHINLGLTELYKRFPLLLQEVIVRQYDQIQTYILHSDFAVTNTESTEPIKYIHDSIYQPFTDNILQIDRIFNEIGEELFNNESDPYLIYSSQKQTSNRYWSVSTPAFNTIQVPYPEKENAMSVIYKAGHERIPTSGIDPTKVEVKIPPNLEEALLLYIAARAYTGMGGENVQVGMAYTQRFEQSVMKIKELGLSNQDVTVNQRLEVNGWV